MKNIDIKDIFGKAIRIVAFVLLASVVFLFISAGCERKTFYDEWNYMAKLNEFYSMEEDSLDYVVVGSSHAYCTVNPLEVWEENGIAGFVLATQQQPLRASYHYIKEAFKTQSPEYVFLEGYMICGEDNYDPAVLYDALDPLKFSFNKLEMVNNLVEYDQRPEFYLNILKYHTRWSSLPANKIEALFEDNIDIHKGFVPVRGSYVGEANQIPDYDSYKDVELSEFNLEVLNDIYELVEDNGSELILLIGPYATVPEEEWLCERIKAEIKWAEGKGVSVLDYAVKLDELGIDPAADYYDATHLDVSGAAKISAHLAAYLGEKGIKENERIDKEQWQKDFDEYYEVAKNDLEPAVEDEALEE